MTDSEIERIAKLEIRLEHLTDTLERTAAKVTELHEIMVAARGARWAIVGVAGLAGFLSGKAGSLITGLLGK